MHFDAYRFSISWSRIFPSNMIVNISFHRTNHSTAVNLHLYILGLSDADGFGEINWEGVDYYNRLIDYLLENGMVRYFQFSLVLC